MCLGIGFSNGWKETFMSGDQEPWVFRGGLTADLQVYLIKKINIKILKEIIITLIKKRRKDKKTNVNFILQRLIPVDSGNDLFVYKAPEVPSSKIYTIRPYLASDEDAVYAVCNKICNCVTSSAIADR